MYSLVGTFHLYQNAPDHVLNEVRAEGGHDEEDSHHAGDQEDYALSLSSTSVSGESSEDDDSEVFSHNVEHTSQHDYFDSRPASATIDAQTSERQTELAHPSSSRARQANSSTHDSSPSSRSKRPRGQVPPERQKFKQHLGERGNALEMAILGGAKRFIKTPAVQSVVSRIWSGEVVYASSNKHAFILDDCASQAITSRRLI